MRPVSPEAKAALALMMSGAGISILNTDLQARDGGERLPIDVVCHSVTRDGGEAQVVPLAIIVDDHLLRYILAPDDWEVRDGRG
jgi:hypothetical protein